MKTAELFESMQDVVARAIEQAEQQPYVINWDEQPGWLNYEEALENATFDILGIHDLDPPPLKRFMRQADLIELVHKMIRRRVIARKRQEAK